MENKLLFNDALINIFNMIASTVLLQLKKYINH